MTNRDRVMPDFKRGFHAFHHTLSSALSSLYSAGVDSARVSVKMAGFGYPTSWIVEQAPAPGAILSLGTRVTLFVAGASFFDHLPVGMWDRGDELAPGTAELLEPIDDPIQKATNWLREGARLLDIQPGRPDDCARWISLFGLAPERWPPTLWYPLAVLLPSLQALAGTLHGIRFALDLLLDLPLLKITPIPRFAFIEQSLCTRLGSAASNLGVDAVVGDRMEDIAGMALTIGPVALNSFHAFHTREKADVLRSTLDLVVPFDQQVVVSWRVQDPAFAPVLGEDVHNSVLGINSYLGASGGARKGKMLREGVT